MMREASFFQERLGQDGKKQAEILAPAGSFDSMKAAVAAGADAVYMGAAGSEPGPTRITRMERGFWRQSTMCICTDAVCI